MSLNRKLATIQRVKHIESIPNRDRIGYASFEDIGYKVICELATIHEGDLVVYCEPDTLLPTSNPSFDFLKDRCYSKKYDGYRISCMRMAGLYSEGIVFPISILPSKYTKRNVGTNVTDILGIRKYEPDINNVVVTCNKYRDTFLYKFISKYIKRISPRLYKLIMLKVYNKGLNAPLIPSKYAFITDETRIQVLNNVVDYLNKMQDKSNLVYTEKIDGSSVTCIYKVNEKELVICNRNYVIWSGPIELVLKKGLPTGTMDDRYVKILRGNKVILTMLHLAKLLPEYKSFTLQGELVGPGIQKNIYGLNDYEWFVFNAYADRRYCVTKDNVPLINIVRDLDLVKVIPIKPLMVDYEYNDFTVDKLLEFSKGRSYLNNKAHREGIVIRDYTAKMKITNDIFSFKVINPDFALRQSTTE